MSRPAYREKAPTKSLKPMYLLTDLFMAQLPTGKLHLADVGLADDGCDQLAEQKEVKGLNTVDLRGNRITSTGLVKIVQYIKKCGNLEYLSINWNDLENDTSAGIDALAYYFADVQNCHIKYLDLRNSNLTMNSKDQLLTIIRSPNLRFLELSWNTFNDTLTPELARAISEREAALQLELKGTGLSAGSLNTINETLKALGSRFPTTFEKRFASEDILKDDEGKKRLLLENLYNNEKVKKMSKDAGRVVLNPDTAELELLMGEMIRKKLLAKDNILKELDEKIRILHDIDVEMAEMAIKRDKAANDNLALRSALEAKKTEYSKTKQNFAIEQENLNCQLKSIQSTTNRREIEHRGLVDKMLHEHRMRTKNYANELERRETHLMDKIKNLSLDKERLEKELTNLKAGMISFTNNFNVELQKKEEQARLEERVRAEIGGRLLDSRNLQVTEGTQMAQRRGIDELKSLEQHEDQSRARIQALQDELHQKRSILQSIDEAVRTVQTNNDRLLDEEMQMSTSISTQNNHITDLRDQLLRKKEMVETNAKEAQDRESRKDLELEGVRTGQEDRLNDLETSLRKVKREIEKIDSQREYFVDIANRKVSKVIYDGLVGTRMVQERV